MNYEDLPLYRSVVGKKDFTGWARSVSTDPEFSYWMINGAWQFTVIRKFGVYQLYIKGEEKDFTEPIEGVNTFDEVLEVAQTMWRMS